MGFLTPGEVPLLWGQQQDAGTRFRASKKGSSGPQVLLQLPHHVLSIHQYNGRSILGLLDAGTSAAKGRTRSLPPCLTPSAFTSRPAV